MTKIGAVRDDKGNWPHARSASQLREQIESNLENLGLDQIEVANVRVGGQDRPEAGSIAGCSRRAAALQSEGLSSTSVSAPSMPSRSPRRRRSRPS